ncbi:hypothetical protein D9Q98_003070 [Chlorella vulgaris]|uniref:FAS1 domain-containing protein n=1 Tax=Chlorella vulgaris TaxID=3077 RepID=A0A9D4TUH6_CHLVU|nr:hypothetical protein D9Q98_003070 [Chlorella vulgaris]
MRCFILCAILALVASPAAAQAPAPAGPASVAELVANTADTSILLAAVQAAGLTEALSDPDLVATVFAPTDDAFVAALEALNVTAAEILADTELLTTVLTYHVVPGAAVMAADLVDGDAFQSMLAGPTGELTFMAPASLMTTSGQTVNIITTDIMAGKAVVHLIDMVMLPDMGMAMAPAPEMMM